MTMTSLTRPAANAGTFYPNERSRLLDLVDDQLEAAAEYVEAAHLAPEALRGVIVPHAGLAYSGVVAAAGWTAVRDARPTTVVLAGTDHEARAGGVAVWTEGAWSCPLGEAGVDEPLAAEVVGLGGPFRENREAHAWEHSLEVQLPFIVRALPGVLIVPMLVSPYLRDAEEILGAMLGRLLAAHRDAGERLLLVASSDFAHYPPAQVAEHVDARLLEPIRRLDPTELLHLEREIIGDRLPGLACGLCGLDPVRLTLAAAHDMGATRGVLLRHATSADVVGTDPTRTVGYASVALVA